MATIAEDPDCITLVEWVVTLRDERFTWLSSGQDEPVGGFAVTSKDEFRS